MNIKTNGLFQNDLNVIYMKLSNSNFFTIRILKFLTFLKDTIWLD